METLLISPAERSEIVLGKFFAVVAMGFGTAVWNVLLMVVAVAVVQVFFPHSLLSLPGLAACVLAALPLAMLIAACGLALGVFARSTKEGNYYMVPMFFVALPLSYWSMTPGMELDGFTSWVPVANALLLQQRLMAMRPTPSPGSISPRWSCRSRSASRSRSAPRSGNSTARVRAVPRSGSEQPKGQVGEEGIDVTVERQGKRGHPEHSHICDVTRDLPVFVLV